MTFQNSCITDSIYSPKAINQIYNVALGNHTTLNELFNLTRDRVAKTNPVISTAEPSYRDFRNGDVRHSQASIDKIQRHLGYIPTHRVEEGLNQATEHYVANITKLPELTLSIKNQ